MKISGIISFALLASFASALPAGKVKKPAQKSHQVAAAVHHPSTPTKAIAAPATAKHHKTVSKSQKAVATPHTPTVHAKISPTSASPKHQKSVSKNHEATSTVHAKVSPTSASPKHQKSVSKNHKATSAVHSLSTHAKSPSRSKSATATATVTHTASVEPTFTPVSCSDISSTSIWRRAFPNVPGIKACSKIETEDELLRTLVSNGKAWIKTLADTQKSPPEPPSNIKDFLSKYTPSLKTGQTIDDINNNAPESIKLKMGTHKYNLVTLKTSEGKEPYQAAVSEDGSVMINKHSFTREDIKEKNQGIQFEDMMTYILAFSMDPDGFRAGTVNIPSAVGKIKYIFRSNIQNVATMQMIAETYKKNGKTKLMDKAKMLEPGITSDEAYGLIATNNGSLGPKLLGTNMKTFGRGSIKAIYIVARPEAMLIELEHGKLSKR